MCYRLLARPIIFNKSLPSEIVPAIHEHLSIYIYFRPKMPCPCVLHGALAVVFSKGDCQQLQLLAVNFAKYDWEGDTACGVPLPTANPMGIASSA